MLRSRITSSSSPITWEAIPHVVLGFCGFLFSSCPIFVFFKNVLFLTGNNTFYVLICMLLGTTFILDATACVLLSEMV